MVAAMEREVRPLVKNWRTSEKEHSGGRFRFFENGDLVVVCAGIGAGAARRAAEAIIALYEPRIVYSVGFAGALDGSWKVGGLVRPQRVVNAKDGSSITLEDGSGVLVSFESIASPEQKVKLRDSFSAHAVDMEAAAVAQAAEARGISFAAAKAISDEVGFEFPSIERFVDPDGRFSEARFAVFAAVRPWIWLQVFRLARNSRRASGSLCAFLRGLSEQPRK